jgi:hypothetical protein
MLQYLYENLEKMLGSSPNVNGNKYFAMMISPVVTVHQHSMQAKTIELAASVTQLQTQAHKHVSVYVQHTAQITEY